MFQSRKESQSLEEHEQEGEGGEMESEDVEEQDVLPPAAETSNHKEFFIHVMYFLYFKEFTVRKSHMRDN